MVRVPGSNPGGTILFSLLFLFYPPTPFSVPTHLSPVTFLFILYTTYYILHLSYLLFTTLFFIYFFSYSIYLLYSIPSFSLKASVAQLVAALDWRSKGHWFEPGREHSFLLYTLHCHCPLLSLPSPYSERFHGVVGYHIILTWWGSPDRTRVKPFFFFFPIIPTISN